MDAVLDNIRVVVFLVLFIGASIFIHELGHYLVARALGLVVEVFSIGFGPAIWKKKVGGIVYKIGWIPFGGYVALPQIDPTGMSRIQAGQGEGDAKVIPAIPPWKKILVALAGAAGNVILAVGIAWFVFWQGMPATPAERSAAVGYVDETSEAFEKGIRMGDEIVSIDGKAVTTWQEVMLGVTLSPEVTLGVRSADGRESTVTVTTVDRSPGREIPGLAGRSLCMVGEVIKDSPAETAGIQKLDIIVGFDGKEVLSQRHLTSMVTNLYDVATTVTVKRKAPDGQVGLHSFPISPKRYKKEKSQTMLGVAFMANARDYDHLFFPTPREQLAFHSTAVFRVLGALTNRKKAGAAQGSIGGPFSVILTYWYTVKISVMVAIWFTGFLNVNLAIINLLPIPVLDGGHIVFALWEISTRRPVNERVANALVNVSMVMLLGLFLLLTVRDVSWWTPLGEKWKDLWAKDGGTNAPPAVVAPAPPVEVSGPQWE